MSWNGKEFDSYGRTKGSEMILKRILIEVVGAKRWKDALVLLTTVDGDAARSVAMKMEGKYLFKVLFRV